MTVTQKNVDSAHMKAMAMLKKYERKKAEDTMGTLDTNSADLIKKLFIQGIVADPELYQEYMTALPDQMTRLMQRYNISQPTGG